MAFEVELYLASMGSGTFGADEGIRKIVEAEDERTEVEEINEKRWYARKRRRLREN